MFYHIGYNKKITQTKCLTFFMGFFPIFSPKLTALLTSVLLTRLFSASLILVSKLVFVNQLNFRVLIKWLVSGILFLISAVFAFRALVARLKISEVFFSISITFVLRRIEVTKLVILGIFLLVAVI